MQRKVLQVGSEEFNQTYLNFLLRGPKVAGEENPLDWLPSSMWNSIQALSQIDEFSKLPADMQEASPRFKEWFNHTSPESEKLPLDWSRLEKEPFLKLMVVRCIRPDRMTVAMRNFITENLPDGKKYVESDSTLSSTQVLSESLIDSSPETPIYFILSAGVNAVADIDKCAIEYNMEKQVNYHNISMGQGQDVIAMQRLEVAHKQGHWVILNNIHLMTRWCIELEKKLDAYNLEGNHERMRIFLTSEPSSDLPIGILSRSLKLTNEPPTGLKANLMRAISSLPESSFNEQETKTRAIMFGLLPFPCHCHGEEEVWCDGVQHQLSIRAR